MNISRKAAKGDARASMSRSFADPSFSVTALKKRKTIPTLRFEMDVLQKGIPSQADDIALRKSLLTRALGALCDLVHTQTHINSGLRAL